MRANSNYASNEYFLPVKRLTFFGLEKNATAIRLAKRNLAVHGLEGHIQKAITYYEDPHMASLDALRKALQPFLKTQKSNGPHIEAMEERLAPLANDWSLTPGHYVGVAPEEEDENFDFEETLREIHVDWTISMPRLQSWRSG